MVLQPFLVDGFIEEPRAGNFILYIDAGMYHYQSLSPTAKILGMFILSFISTSGAS